MVRYCLVSLVVSKNTINGDYGLSALEVLPLFFAQEVISVCGDALYALSSLQTRIA